LSTNHFQSACPMLASATVPLPQSVNFAMCLPHPTVTPDASFPRQPKIPSMCS
jgi:hypothetical protein